MKRLGLVLAVFWFSASIAQSQSSSQFSGLNTSLNANAGGAGTVGTAFTAPPGSDAALVTWTASYSAPPASVTMLLQASLDNSTWFTLDTSTAVAGELRNIETSARFFRCNISAVSGAVNKTCSFVLKRSNSAVSSGGSIFAGNVTAGGDVTSGDQFLAANGTIGAPSYSFTNDSDSGLYSFGPGQIGLSINGAMRTYWNGTTMQQVVGAIQVPDGTALLPSYTFTSEPTLGFWRSAAGTTTHQGTLNVTSNFNGALNVAAGASNALLWNSRTAMYSPANGVLNINQQNSSTGSQIKVDALPTIASGFGTSAAISAGSTPFAGSLNIGTGGVATTGVINFNGTAFPSAPFCVVSTRLGNNAVTGAQPSTTAMIINASTAWAANEIVSWICVSAK